MSEAVARFPLPLFLDLNAELEVSNLQRAQLIRHGRLYATPSILANTRDFISYEQHVVEQRLRQLRSCEPARVGAEIRIANQWLALMQSDSWAALCDPRLVAALGAAVRSLAGPIDIADRTSRELIGLHLASRCG